MNSRVLPLGAIIFAIAIFAAYINPTWTGSIAETQAAIASDNQALAAANAYMAEESQLVKERNAIKAADLSRLSVFLPNSVDNVGLILDLNALAARSGLSFANINVSSNDTSGNTNASTGALPAAGADPVGSVDLSVSAVGTYTALQNFLRGVEMSERLLDVRDLSIKGSDTGVYNYGMTLRLYWLR